MKTGIFPNPGSPYRDTPLPIKKKGSRFPLFSILYSVHFYPLFVKISIIRGFRVFCIPLFPPPRRDTNSLYNPSSSTLNPKPGTQNDWSESINCNSFSVPLFLESSNLTTEEIVPTHHKIDYQTAASGMQALELESIDLIVTSPPYPMIEMWDEVFSQQNPAIRTALGDEAGSQAFELMHAELDRIWEECLRVLKPGGILCINIGDATRKIGDDFQLFSSHSRILSYCLSLGFQNLPNILWRKQTNAPNKFMGSGMLPPGAYVTLEHEYILVFRKGGKREFSSEKERALRRESAYFWEERNLWFSDIWYGLKGTHQNLNHDLLRDRSGAFPFELAYRLINMYSIKKDMVLDPFLGTGTTTLAAMIAERNSFGFEIDSGFKEIMSRRAEQVKPYGTTLVRRRLRNHLEFVRHRLDEGKTVRNINAHYGFPCISQQEIQILLKDIEKVDSLAQDEFKVTYRAEPQESFCQRSPGEIHIPSEQEISGETGVQSNIFE